MKRSLKISKTGLVPGTLPTSPLVSLTTSTNNTDTQIEDILKTCKSKFSHEDNTGVKWIRKKTSFEVNFLEEMFQRDPSWGRKTVQICKKALNLNTDQVYKWGYDKKLLLKKKIGGASDPLCNREIARQVKKEVFLAEDLNVYVSSLSTWWDTLKGVPSLNEVSSSLRNQENNTVKISKITKNLSVCKTEKLDKEEGRNLKRSQERKGVSAVPANPFAPYHQSSLSLFDMDDTISGSNETIQDNEIQESDYHQKLGDSTQLCDPLLADCSGTSLKYILDPLVPYI